MKTFKWLAVGLLPMALVVVQAPSAAPGNGAERARVYVVYKDGQRGNAARALAMAGAEVHFDFAGLRGYAVSLPAVALEGLARNPAIEYVEEDPKRYLMAETVPYGITAVQADVVPALNNSSTQVCIIDSGYNLGHEDLPSSNVDGHNDPNGSGNWYEDANSHGTHVAGTVAAVGDKGKGVVGVLPGVGPSESVSLFIVKVFGAETWTYSSSLVDALNKCTGNPQRGSRNLVVNMSLGGSVKSRFEETAFANANGTGKVLSIASAGNDGNSRNSYPASYSSVVSVAAVDQKNAWASFSQYNSQVEIAAPGVGVLSTVPMGTGTSSTVTVTDLSPAPEAEAMDGSPRLSGAGVLVDCGIGDKVCSLASGKVCLIQRGTVSFSDKVLNCEAGGGSAAIIYNNVAGPLLGTLGGVSTSIPSVGVSDEDGTRLLGKIGVSATVAVAASNYAKYDGTSMAAPHVSGVAALVWSNSPSCTNTQLRNVLNATAKDLGAAGRDVYYGHGLVQAAAAVTALSNNCGGTSSGGSGGGGGGGGKGGGPKK
jgi:serine protease